MGMAASKHEAFWEACGFGHTDKVRRMIEEGINVNWISYQHNSSALHVASQGKPEIVRMLLDANCNVHVKDDRGNLALHHAAMKGHADIIQMLLDAGSEIDTQEKNGWTALLNAAYWCHPDAVEVLLKNKCDVHLKNKDKRTALHEACRSQSQDEDALARIVKMLADNECPLNDKSSDEGEADFTPLMFAAYHGHPEAARVLIEEGCDINASGTNKWSALHWAADRGHQDVVWVLIEGGIDVLQEGDRGELAVERARDRDIKEIILDAARRKRGQSVETTSTLDTDGSADEANANTSLDEEAFKNADSQVSTPVIPMSESYENFVRETAETIAPLAAGDDLTTSQIKTPTNEVCSPIGNVVSTESVLSKGNGSEMSNSTNGNSTTEHDSNNKDLQNGNNVMSLCDQNENNEKNFLADGDALSEKLSEARLNENNQLVETAST